MTTVSIDQIMTPLGWTRFEAEYKGKRPLHLKGSPDKFAGVMSWELLSQLLSQTSIWSPATLGLQLDTRTVDPLQFCVAGTDREQHQALVPDMAKVADWLRRGASLVLNDIADLAPGLKAAASALEAAAGGKVQANLYCSWQSHQAFSTHFDTHDVYAFHVAGQKTWQLYRQAFVDPIAHPRFKSLGKDYHEAQRGPVTMTADLSPGDLLYIPRGWYHDALASSAGSVHVAFGLTTLIGLALLEPLFERAVDDPLFRASLPAGPGLEAHLAALGEKLAGYLREERFLAQSREAIAAFRYPRASISLPLDVPQQGYRRRSDRLTVVWQGDRASLQEGSKAVPIPPGLEHAVAWVVGRPEFSEAALVAAFPNLDSAGRAEFLRALLAMRVVEKI